MKTTPTPMFTEEQNLKIPAMRLLLGLATVVAVGSFMWEIYKEGWSQAMLLAGLPMLLILALIWWLIERSRIYTRVTPEGIAYRFFPLQLKERFARWEELREIYLRGYSAMGEYGGWGLRYGFGLGWGYIAEGEYGLQLVYKSGKKRFISTQRMEELKIFLEQYAPVTTLKSSDR